jgi:small subunit ribosomal protein S20
MPLLKNAIKKMRQDKKRAEVNKGRRSSMRTSLKTALTEKTPEALNHAFSVLDKAAKSHLIHKGKADRLKSRLAKAIAKAVSDVAAVKPKTTKTAAKKKTATKKKTTKAAAK